MSFSASPGSVLPLWVRIEARWSGNAYFERVRGVFDVKKYRICETMLIQLSTVGFALLGSY